MFSAHCFRFVDCGKIQDCDLKLNVECLDGGLNLLGDFVISLKIRSIYYVFKVTWERNLKACKDKVESKEEKQVKKSTQGRGNLRESV